MTFETIDRAIAVLGRGVGLLLDTIIALLVAGLLVIVFSQFIDRNYVTFWRDSPEEYVKIGLTWLCYVGIARAFSTDETIRITFLHEVLPKPAILVIETLLDLLLLVLLAILTVKSIVMVQMAQYQIVLGTDFSLAVPATGVLVGVVLLIPLIAWRLVRRLAIQAGWLQG
ncbi:TRAP transporter small permease subunit [Methylobrevis albus]|uniref:TRAP transporter small permease protein n=1 Tax=Methylobrevis albus TaxID=2793297 RepID=A0A931I2Y6_9HYPH|nr:TRAP transporter small permease subunit [Methylobrevis albus]MBH0238489.1 TRAP transporter small permease subunit [Methylobrevis albus]